MKKAIVAVALLALLGAGCSSNSNTNFNYSNGSDAYQGNPSPAPKPITPRPMKTYPAPHVLDAKERTNKEVVMETDKGTITLELFGDEAPLTVSNFILLAKQGYYDGLAFHRVEPNFVIQGGDPLGNGTGGPGYQFKDEPVKRKYDPGILAMANAGPDTNGSQFFVMLPGSQGLPPLYTIFGKVLSGMEVVSNIQVGDVMKKVTIIDKK